MSDDHDTAIANINARIDLLSSQVLQISQMLGSSAERTQQNGREVVNYVTSKIEELTNAVVELQGGLHNHGEPDSNGKAPEQTADAYERVQPAADGVRTGGRGRREGAG